MANNNRRRRRSSTMATATTFLSRDLLNLALVLALLHVEPDSYLGLNMMNENSFAGYSSKIVDDLSALGRYAQFEQEISAYVLNAETDFSSAVNNLNINNEDQVPDVIAALPMEEDSGVSDVDSGHQSGEDEDENLSLFQSSASASPAHLEDEDFTTRSDQHQIKLEEDIVHDFFDVPDESSNIFKDLDDIIGQAEDPPQNNDTIEMEEFAPDEEDVENQLMHIDDQLIRLDENIEDINLNLDEQLLNTATVVENEALLTQEEENLLFSSMPEVMDPMQSWSLADPRDQEIEELIAAGLPSPLMPSPFLVNAADEEPKTFTGENPVVKKEIKEEIKEEPLDEQGLQGQDDLSWLAPYMSPAASPSSDSLASTNLPMDLLGTLEDEEEGLSHLHDHNYALSAFDECFGSETASSSLSQKESYPPSVVDGASALYSHRESRDERKARELNLPFHVDEIVDLPIDAYNELLSKYTLTEAQLMLCRDIRRRGKNKVAAQNCRKRKMDLISQLEAEVTRARQQKQMLLAEREELYRLRDEWTHKLLNLETAVLSGLNKNVKDYSFDYSGASVRVTTRLAKAKA